MLLCDLERGSTGVWVVESEPDYLCLGADNKLYQASSRAVGPLTALATFSCVFWLGVVWCLVAAGARRH
jgi:hypothetical protein